MRAKQTKNLPCDSLKVMCLGDYSAYVRNFQRIQINDTETLLQHASRVSFDFLVPDLIQNN